MSGLSRLAGLVIFGTTYTSGEYGAKAVKVANALWAHMLCLATYHSNLESHWLMLNITTDQSNSRLPS